MKNILYIEDNRDRTIGGSYYSLLYLIKGLDKESYNPLVLFHWENDLVGEFQRADSQVVVRNDFTTKNLRKLHPNLFSGQGWKSSLFSVMQKMINLFTWVWIFFFKYPRLLLGRKIDIVHINNSIKVDLFWMIIPRIIGIKCVCHQRGFIEPSVRIGCFRRFVINRVLNKVICISEAILNDCRKHGIHNTTIIYNGLDEKDFVSKLKGLDLKSKFSFPSDVRPVLGVIGNIKEWKGQHVVIDAVAALRKVYPQIRCLVVGARPQKDKSNKYAQFLLQRVNDLQLDENVVFTGYRNDIPDLINGMDILVHSSIDPEPFGRVILEGMALKKPVVATAHGGPLEIIRSGESGVLVPPGDPEALAEALKKLTEDEGYATRIALGGHERLTSEFSSAQNVRKTENLYQSLW